MSKYLSLEFKLQYWETHTVTHGEVVVETDCPWRKISLFHTAQKERYCILYLGLICPDVPPVSCPAQTNPLMGRAGYSANLSVLLSQDISFWLSVPVCLLSSSCMYYLFLPVSLPSVSLLYKGNLAKLKGCLHQ